MPTLVALAVILLSISSGPAASAEPWDRDGRLTAAQTMRDSKMPDDIAAELSRLRLNQAVLLAAVNRLIANTAPIALSNPADGSSGYVSTGLVLDADGLLVLGTIPAPDPHSTLRGVRSGDPLWTEAPGSP